jgi:hypothetical protein
MTDELQPDARLNGSVSLNNSTASLLNAGAAARNGDGHTQFYQV